jgi:hypothetical protein
MPPRSTKSYAKANIPLFNNSVQHHKISEYSSSMHPNWHPHNNHLSTHANSLNSIAYPPLSPLDISTLELKHFPLKRFKYRWGISLSRSKHGCTVSFKTIAYKRLNKYSLYLDGEDLKRNIKYKLPLMNYNSPNLYLTWAKINKHSPNSWNLNRM